MLTIVLLPGMDGTGNLFSPFTDVFPKDWHAHVVPYPNNQLLSYKELELIIKNTLPVNGDYILIGESFSGPLAITLAASADERLKALVLSCTFVKNPIKFGSEAIRLLAKFPLFYAPKKLIDSFLLGRFRKPEVSKLLHATLKKVPSKIIAHRIREVQEVNVSDTLAKVNVPSLYLRATEDRLISASASELVLALHPKIEISEIEAPHCLLQTSPVQAVATIREFLNKT